MVGKEAQLNIKGMLYDLDPSKIDNTYSFINKNIRFITNEHSNTYAISNEKGPSFIGDIKGAILGHAEIADFVVLFTHENNTDRIYSIPTRYLVKNGLTEKYNNISYSDLCIIYEGNLNFQYGNEIETLTYYENEKIIKVYWVDGINQPRLINIAEEILRKYPYTNSSYIGNPIHDGMYSSTHDFDFVPKLKLKETVHITKSNVAKGLFPAGTIQYCFTYYNKYAQQSNIFYQSPLYYLSHSNRGVAPGEIETGNGIVEHDTADVCFDIEIDNPDTNFEYCRIYSLIRTDKDSTPQVKIVADIEVGNNSSIKFTDYNLGEISETVSPTDLLFVGGNIVHPNTITQKDDKLFYGNFKIKDLYLNTIVKDGNNDIVLKDYIKNKILEAGISVDYKIREADYPKGIYDYTSTLKYDSSELKHFKSREWYRIGVQLQNDHGYWSEVIALKDVYIDKVPKNVWGNNDLLQYHLPYIKVINNNTVLSDLFNTLTALGFKKIRTVVVYPNLAKREVIAQGYLCPTVFNTKERNSNSPFAMSSWFARPLPRYNDTNLANLNYSLDGVFNPTPHGKFLGWMHYMAIKNAENVSSEINCITENLHSVDGADINKNACNFFIDTNIITMHSPEFEFDNSIKNISSNNSNLKLRIVGRTLLTSNNGDINIDAEPTAWGVGDLSGEWTKQGTGDDKYSNEYSVAVNMIPKGFYKEPVQHSGLSSYAHRVLSTGVYWFDSLDGFKTSSKNQIKMHAGEIGYPWLPYLNFGFVVYPFNFNTLSNYTDGKSTIKKKVISNIRYSAFNSYLSAFKNNEDKAYKFDDGLADFSIFDTKESSLIKLKAPRGFELSTLNYWGNVEDYAVTNAGLYASDSIDNSADDGYKDAARKTTTGADINIGGNTIGIRLDSTHNHINLCPNKKDLFDTSNAATVDRYEIQKDRSGDTLINYTESISDIYNNKPLFNWEANRSHFYNLTSTAFNMPHSPKVPGSGHTWSWGELCKGIQKPFKKTGAVKMEYTSTSHGVIVLQNPSDNRLKILPTLQAGGVTIGSHGYADTELFWDKGKTWNWNSGIIKQEDEIDYIEYSKDYPYGFLWLAEIYQDTEDTNYTSTGYNDKVFGGHSEEILAMHDWLPAGKAVDINVNNEIAWEEGDTYYQRYDNVKTYPKDGLAKEPNMIVDIISYMVETKINLDGRYDRNQGKISYLAHNQEKFNLINNAYTQDRNFFKYKYVKYDNTTINNFENVLGWTMSKTVGEKVDQWTKLNYMASSLLLDGDKGQLQALRNVKNTVIAIQDSGIAKIMYNDRTALSTTEGVPVQIGNSEKVDGKEYINPLIGCQSRKSVINSRTALYFFDRYSNNFYITDGQSIQSISGGKFHSFITNSDKGKGWLNYDYLNNDVVFTLGSNNNGYNCLSFNEMVNDFTSFYDYDLFRYFINIQEKTVLSGSIENNSALFLHNDGEYNKFYDSYDSINNKWNEALKGYEMTMILNDAPYADKVFNHITLTADILDIGKDKDSLSLINSKYRPVKLPFTHIRAWNEYQETLETELKDKESLKSYANSKQKYRIWRFDIPREQKDNKATLKRMRNPWLYLNIKKDYDNNIASDDTRMVLHTLSYNYLM